MESGKHIMIVGSFAESLLNFRGDLIKELIRTGWRVTAAAPNFSSKIKNTLQGYGADYVEIPLERSGLNPVTDLMNLFKIIKIVKATNPDLVFSYTIKPNIWGAIAANRVGIESIAMVTGLGYAFTDTDKPSLKSRIVRLISKMLYSFSTSKNKAVIFQNPDDKDDFLRLKYLKDPSKARIVNGSGVNMEYFRRVVLPDAPICLFIGRLHKNKGIREYGEAAVLLKKKYPEARFLIVGYFDEGPDSIQESDIAGWVEHGVEFIGHVVDIRESISMASIYVLPSYREGTPRSTLEAMSMGRPIITTNAPGCRETVIDRRTGYIVPIRDIPALASKIECLINNDELRSEMGKNSYELCRKKYDVNSVNDAIIDILLE